VLVPSLVIQRDSKTLLDHILTNSRTLDICAGTFISDVSNHFFTFVIPFFEPTSKQQHKTVLSRDFSQQNMLGFRNELGMADWTNVTGKTSVGEAYDEFWNTYNGLYNRFFQIKRIRFNKNKHKIHNFMTNGLLVSRNTKKNSSYDLYLGSLCY
jgi:hypothetical protein